MSEAPGPADDPFVDDEESRIAPAPFPPPRAATRRSLDGSATEPPEPPESRTARYRQREARRRGPWGAMAAWVVAIAVAAVAIHLLTSPAPAIPPPISAGAPTNYGEQGSGPAIGVDFGSPSVTTATCASGGSAPIERIPWISASHPPDNTEIAFKLVELGDGDVVGGGFSNAPHVSGGAVCAGSPPAAATHQWYAVLADPSGTNLESFCFGIGWTPVDGAPSPVVIANGSSVTVVLWAEIADSGFGLEVSGSEGSTTVQGTVPL